MTTQQKQPTIHPYNQEPMALIPYSRLTVEELYLLVDPICDGDLNAVVMPVKNNTEKLILLIKRDNLNIKFNVI